MSATQNLVQGVNICVNTAYLGKVRCTVLIKATVSRFSSYSHMKQRWYTLTVELALLEMAATKAAMLSLAKDCDYENGMTV